MLDGGAGNDVVDAGDDLVETVPVTITASGGTVVEGDSGTSSLVFTLTLSTVSLVPVTVSVSTTDGSANFGSDYTAITNQLVTFAPGSVTRTVSVTINGDPTREFDETVRLLLNSPSNARLANAEAAGTISDDDGFPQDLYAVGIFGPRNLSRINSNTAATTTVGPTGLSIAIGLATDGAGNLVAVENNSVQTRIFTIDPLTGFPTPGPIVTGLPDINNFGMIPEGDIAFDVPNNLLYAVPSSATPNLYQIDPTTGEIGRAHV